MYRRGGLVFDRLSQHWCQGYSVRELIPSFDDPKCYLEVLDALAKKWGARGRLSQLQIRDLTLRDLRSGRARLANILAETVAANEYRFSPLVPVQARIDRKLRQLYRPNLLDRVVLTVVARYLSVLAEPTLLPNLYSYRKGQSPWRALAALGDYLSQHRRQVSVKERGLYVLRRDISKYGESIAIDPASPLWPTIERIIDTDPNRRRRSVGASLVRAAILQSVVNPDGAAAPLSRGVPTGSPIQPPCANLYLSSIDEFCTSIAGAFYSRFGDDILFCHPDRATTQSVSRELEVRIASLGLTVKREKQADFDFNGAGRVRSPAAGFRNCANFEYLGAAVDFAGRLGLKRQKARDFEREMRLRLHHVACGFANASTDSQLSLVCDTVRNALVPTAPTAVSAAEFLRHIATDRAQLRDLDYRMALMAAELLTNHRGPRAFRRLTYARLRKSGFPSLVATRDRARAADRAAR